MPFLTIAGTSYKVTRFRWDDPARRGEDVRAFDNTLLAGTDLPKRKGGGELVPLAMPALNTLRAAVASPVSCGGDAMQGGAGTFRVRITSEEAGPERVATGPNSYRENWSGPPHWTVSLTLEEV